MVNEATSETDNDPGPPPGDEHSTVYNATDFVRSGGRGGGGFIWFSCKDGGHDRVLQLANLREMEPGGLTGGQAWLHFSGMDVMLEGSRTREVVHRIFLGRCSIVREIRPDQQPEKTDAPVITAIRFFVPGPPDSAPNKPQHEPEIRAREKTS